MTYQPTPALGSPGVAGTVVHDTVRAAAGPVDALAPAPKRKRLATLDLMRGYYVGVLAAIHLDYVPSLLGLVDGRGSLLVSEAEGFFMIAGLLVGMLRRRDLERHGPLRMTLNSWKRALQLYLVAVPLTLLFTVIGRVAVAHGHNQVKGGLDVHSSPLSILVSAMTLRYTYGWADFLTFYVPMFLVAPLAVWLLSKRLWPLVLSSRTPGTGCPRIRTRSTTARFSSGASTSSSARRPGTTARRCAPSWRGSARLGTAVSGSRSSSRPC